MIVLAEPEPNIKASPDDEISMSFKVIESATPKEPQTVRLPLTNASFTIWKGSVSDPPLAAVVASVAVMSPSTFEAYM